MTGWRASTGPVLALAAAGWGANQFSPLIVLYRQLLDLTPATLNAMYGLYALGLVPALLLGGRLSDRVGRRGVVAPALLVVLAGSLLLMGARVEPQLLLRGRLVTGIGCGLVFGTGAAWLKELAVGDDVRVAPRRATLAITAGFALGPLVAGSVAQWADRPEVWAYVPLVVLAVVAVVAALRTNDVRPAEAAVEAEAVAFPLGAFLWLFVPFAPWGFGAAAVFLAYLTPLVAPEVGAQALVFSAVAAAVGAGAGLLAQPVATRLHRPGTDRLLVVAMAMVVAFLLLASVTAGLRSPDLVLVASVVGGFGYGVCQFCGLLHAQLIATPRSLGTVISAYQALSYVGFAFPYLMARYDETSSYGPAVTVLGLTGLAVLSAAALLVGRSRRSASPQTMLTST